jgi:hypothetical protein
MPSTLLLYLNYPHPLQLIATSALKGKAVVGGSPQDVCSWPKADIKWLPANVRFWG